MWREFKAFLLKQNMLALALAVVVGNATNQVVTAIVDDFIMPIIGVVSPGQGWERIVLALGPAQLRVGHFLGAVLHFVIIGFVAWQITKLFLKPPTASERPATRPCPYCRQTIDALATRCAYCTSEVGQLAA